MSGDVTLVDEFAAVQMAIQAAVTDVFSSSDVVGMFAQRDSQALREKLVELDTAHQLSKARDGGGGWCIREVFLALDLGSVIDCGRDPCQQRVLRGPNLLTCFCGPLPGHPHAD